VIYTGIGSATTVNVTATETGSCITATTSDWQLIKCRVVLASSDAIFTATTSVSGGTNRALWISAREYVGLGSFDASCVAGASSCSVTTANASEWLDVDGGDFSNDLSPQTGFFQQQYGSTADLTGSQEVRAANWYKITGGAGSQTAQYTTTNPFPRTVIAAMAFQQSSPPAFPPVILVQQCLFSYPNSTRSGPTCPLHNYTANNFVVYSFGTIIEVSSLNSCIGTNCSCPVNAQTFHNYGGTNYSTGICTASTNSNQAKFEVGISTHSGSGQSGLFVEAGEYSGTTGVVDTGSEASTAALSTSYTTAAGNEFTITACQDVDTNPLVPNSGENVLLNSIDDATSPNQQTSMQIITAALGSHTTSCTMSSGSSRPIIATLSVPINALPNVPRKKGWIGE
jgi:hypothetical protein